MIGSNSINDSNKTFVPKQVAQEPISTTVVVHKDLDITKLNKYIAGSSWSVNYYNQLKAENDNNQPLDVRAIDSIQQFEKIINLELKVTSPIEATHFSNVSGEAILTVGIEPHVGDVFITELDGGRIALFRVITVDHEHYNLNNVFKLEYKLDMFLTKSEEIFVDLEEKVVREFVYDDTYALTNSSGILTKEDYNNKIDLSKKQKELEIFYLNSFYNTSNRTLTVPVITDQVIVDPYNEIFVFSIFNYSNSLVISDINRFAYNKQDLLFDTIYDVLLNKSYKNLTYIENQFCVVRRSSFSKIPVLKTMRYFNIDFVVARSQFDGSSVIKDDELLLVLERSNISITGKNNIPDRFNEKCWLFSKKFYSHSEFSSTIEELVIMYLKDEKLNDNKLYDLLNEYRKWTKLDQFYYIPILVMLLKSRTTQTTSYGT